jgi:hypothetical protein
LSKTADLRKLVKEQLQTIQGGTYHREASNDAAFPYKTFTLQSVTFTDARDDFDLCVDIWHRGDWKVAEEIADQIEELFQNTNIPQETILPTFFRENRYNLEDPDKTLKHIQLRFIVQLYELEV